MFFGKKPATEKVTYQNIKAELDELLGRAETAHINRHTLIDLLESRAIRLRCKQATQLQFRAATCVWQHLMSDHYRPPWLLVARLRRRRRRRLAVC